MSTPFATWIAETILAPQIECGSRVVVKDVSASPFASNLQVHHVFPRQVQNGDELTVEMMSHLKVDPPNSSTPWSGEVIFWKLHWRYTTGFIDAFGDDLCCLPVGCVEFIATASVKTPEQPKKECRCDARSLLFGHEKGCDYA